MATPQGSRGGGLGLAQLACAPDRGYVPRTSRDCTRPVLYGAERFVFGLRTFAVAPGRKVLLTGSRLPLRQDAQVDLEPGGWPTMGGMWFSDEDADPALFVVQKTPALLIRLSMELNAEQDPVPRVTDALALCERADLIQAVPGPGDRPRLALSCPDRAQVWFVDPTAMRVTAQVKVGAGANEMYYEPARRRLWVTNTLEHSLSVVDLDPEAPTYLQERLRLQIHSTNDQAR